MMISMIQHLYADYVDDALELVVVEFLSTNKLMKIVDVINILTQILQIMKIKMMSQYSHTDLISSAHNDDTDRR